MTQNNIRTVLDKHPLIPVVTFNSLDEVSSVVEGLLGKNIHCIEITLRSEIAFDAIEEVVTEYGESMDVGVGTVVTKSQIERSREIGVDFLVSPGLHDSLFIPLENSKIAFIPGVATPSEIMHGIAQGWDTFKFFPANYFGNQGAIKTYGKLFPQVKFCPTGGLSEETHNDFLELDNVISVGGSWMVK